jgi:hypothetical protein
MCTSPSYSLFGNRELISAGKVYTMIRETSSHYTVIDNEGKEREFYKRRFQKLDCGICIERRCNSCPIDKEKL